MQRGPWESRRDVDAEGSKNVARASHDMRPRSTCYLHRAPGTRISVLLFGTFVAISCVRNLHRLSPRFYPHIPMLDNSPNYERDGLPDGLGGNSGSPLWSTPGRLMGRSRVCTCGGMGEI
jgi:hypothetical protein